ncbi:MULTISPECIES: hypothetical protein [unclassified Streptomyces]|uniref:hypothetical protein n=1 Tax=unclassified Streptomyces TaxID=2593676 RepID=UPI0034317AD0
MNRPARLTAAALTLSAALLLSACGGGGDGSTDNGRIKGADAGKGSTASPSASSSAPGSAERPKITLPSDVKSTFAPEEAGDPVKDAVLHDNAEFVRALNAAIVARNPKLPALEFYTEGAAAVAAYNWVKGYTDSGLTVTGTVRYYNRSVKVKSKTSAAIGYCADETKGYDKVVKTGKLKGTTASKNSYVAYVGNLSLNKDGIWELTDLVGTRGAASCQP